MPPIPQNLMITDLITTYLLCGAIVTTAGFMCNLLGVVVVDSSLEKDPMDYAMLALAYTTIVAGSVLLWPVVAVVIAVNYTENNTGD